MPDMTKSTTPRDDVAARWVHVSTLTAWARNPRQNDAAVLPVANSIKRFGWGAPVLAREANGEVVAGHTRLRAVELLTELVKTAKDLDDWHPDALRSAREGMVPVRFGDWNERDAHLLALADNRLNELAEWDAPKLTELMGDYSLEEVEAAGWSSDDLEAMAAGLAGGDGKPPPEEPPTPDPPKDPVTKLGDVWVLGEHRVMCGDSTDARLVAELLDGDSVDLGLHDPPYGINVVSKTGEIGASVLAKTGKYDPVIGDDRPYHPQHLLTLGARRTIIFGANYFHDELPRSGAWLVWDKGRPEGLNFSDVELAWTDAKKTAVKCYRVVWNGMIREGESGPRVHPTQKPVKLMCQIVEDHAEPGGTVLDLFGGSGSVLLACEGTSRRCRMMELSPAYCDVIIERWEQMTGGKAKLEPTP